MSRPNNAATETTCESPIQSAEDRLIVTRLALDVSPEEAWDSLMFYEETGAPAWFLRLLLPLPIRTLGGKAEVGDDALCVYESGYLVKRIIERARGHRLGFEVIRQRITVGDGIRVRGGWYSFTPLPDRRTEVELGTRYVSPWKPRWLWQPIEEAVGHRFHRHILRAMRRRALGRHRLASDGAPT